ncbi:MAG: hydantoin utilization protein A [Planctomycetota bacterium]
MIIEGLLAGTGHVLTGPDHLVGVAPLAVDRTRRVRPAVVGATWGLGHGLGVALLGALGQGILTTAQVEVASGWAERLVGAVLIVLGLLALRRARGLVVHEHAHTHDGDTHVHLHVHGGKHAHAREGEGHGHDHAAFGMGLLHGLAGAGHFWAVLPSLAMPPRAAAVYIVAYVLSSLAIMTVFGAVLGRAARTIGVAWLPRFFTVVGVVTIAVGAWWLVTAFGA